MLSRSVKVEDADFVQHGDALLELDIAAIDFSLLLRGRALKTLSRLRLSLDEDVSSCDPFGLSD